MKIVHVHRVFHDVVTVVVSLGVGESTLYAVARHPDAETLAR
jgi:hypothetical protein